MKKFLLLFIFGFYWFPSISQDDEQDSSRIIQIRDIHIVGNKKTKESVFYRELNLKPGDRYQLKQLVDTLVFDRNRIYNTNLFTEVDITVQELGDQIADLLITVKERWYFWPSPLFKLEDPNFHVWKKQGYDFNRVNYGLRLTKFNARGRNELARVVLQGGFERRFLFNYRIPYIDKKQRHGLSPEFILTTNNNTSYQSVDHKRIALENEDGLLDKTVRKGIGGSLLHTYRKNYYDFHFTTLGFISTQIADTIAFLNPNYFGGGRTSQKLVSFSYGYRNDIRDNNNYPTDGHNYFINLAKIGLGIFDDVDYWTIQGTFSKYKNFGNGYSLGNSVSIFWSSGNQPFFNYRGLGFDNKLFVRGYEGNQIDGQSYILTKNSFRKLLFKHKSDLSKVIPIDQFNAFPIALYGKLFFDGGYVKRFYGYENNDRLTNKFIHGLGLGLDLVTIYDLVVKLEFSRNANSQNNLRVNIMADF